MKSQVPLILILMTLIGCGQSQPVARTPPQQSRMNPTDSTFEPESINRDSLSRRDRKRGVLSDERYVQFKRKKIFDELNQLAAGIKPRPPLPRFSFLDVIEVISGDTFEVETHRKERVLVKLTGIDSPELDQPWGEEARHFLDERITGKTLPMVCTGSDDSGFPSVNVIQKPGVLNLELISAGMAWYSRKHDQHQWLVPYEAAARQSQLGLWGDSHEPIPPWEWRRQRQTLVAQENGESSTTAPDSSTD